MIEHLEAPPTSVIALEVYEDHDGRLAIRGGTSRPLRELDCQPGDTILITKAEVTTVTLPEPRTARGGAKRGAHASSDDY